jgi:hypothetical protein
MQSEPESESEPSSSPNFFCNVAASAAAAVSSRLPIDNGEEMIIKTEEIPSSSTKNITSVKVKKEEEEVVDDEGNGYNDGASASTRNMNHDLNRSVKKEEENDNDAHDEGNNQNDGTGASASASNMNYDLNRSVKKEEENDNDAHDEGNNQNDGTGASASASNMNYDLNRSVKKEEENDNDAPNDDGDYDYSDWKTGNWCLLLPATDNSKNRQEQPEGDGAIAVATKTDVISTTSTGYSSSSGTKRSASQPRYVNDGTNECETAVAAGSDLDPSPNKKMRGKENNIDKDDNSNMKIAAINHETANNVDIGIDIKEKVKEGCSEQDNVNATVDDNDNTNSDDSSTNSNNDNNSDDDDGYESWTEGNWCLLLSPVVDRNDDKTKRFSSSNLSINTKTTYTFKHGRSFRHRSCGSSRTYLEVDGIDNDEDDTMYDDEDDTPMGDNDDDDDNDNPTKRTKSTTTHKKWQKEIWNEMLQKLVSYKKKHRSTTVPRSYQEDPKLGLWVHNQRRCYKTKTLSIYRINRLESIDFTWDPLDAQWMGMYQKLVAYKKQYGSIKLPVRYTEDPQLGQWTTDQRVVFKKNKLSDKRTVLLNSIGFVWDPSDKQWMEMYNRLVAYKKQYKHTIVPRIYPADPQLGYWITNNRFKKDKLTEKRIELLNSIKFSW